MLSILKKTFKWFGIVLAGLVVIVVVAAFAIPYFLPLDKIKTIAAEKASDAIHRQVKIESVSFNIFKGIELRNISVSNRPGFSKEPFVSAGLIELKYDFWALLRGQVRVDKVVLVKPEILIENQDGVSNYQDLIGAKKPKTEKKVSKKKEPVSLLVSRFSIINGKLTMNATVKGVKKVTQLKGLNVNISNIALETKKPIYISVGVTGVYEGKEVPISVVGRALFDMGRSYAHLYGVSIKAAGETLNLDAEVKDFDKAPNIKLSLSSPRIDTDKFMAILSGTGTKKKVIPPYGQQTANINRSLKVVPANIKMTADISLNNIKYKEMKVDSLRSQMTLSNKVLNISSFKINAYKGVLSGMVLVDLNVPGISYSIKSIAGKGFNATPLANDGLESFLTKLPDYKELKGKISGSLSFDFAGAGKGIETPDIISNINGSGSFLLANGSVSKLETLSSIGSKIGIKTFDSEMAIKEFKANFKVANKVVTIKGLALNNGDAGDIKVNFTGSVNIGTLEWVKGNRLAMKLNPKTTQLSSDYDPFKDDNGWYSLEFEMTGALKKPIPIPQLGKPVEQIFNNKKNEAEKAVQKQLDTKQKEVQDAAQKEIDAQKKAAEDKAKQELEDKAKELLKF
jgi:uncharacterized protein involved in outer membrane biogenesis